MESYYTATQNNRRQFPSLADHETADICVIGAGSPGLSSALHLAQKGYKVLILEAETVAAGASGSNRGHVGRGQRADQAETEGASGKQQAHLLRELGVQDVDTE